MNDLILYTTEDGRSQIKLRAQEQTHTGDLYLKFDQDRKRQEPIQADKQDEAELTALESQIKRRREE